jgi:hypothetical protein
MHRRLQFAKDRKRRALSVKREMESATHKRADDHRSFLSPGQIHWLYILVRSLGSRT